MQEVIKVSQRHRADTSNTSSTSYIRPAVEYQMSIMPAPKIYRTNTCWYCTSQNALRHWAYQDSCCAINKWLNRNGLTSAGAHRMFRNCFSQWTESAAGPCDHSVFTTIRITLPADSNDSSLRNKLTACYTRMFTKDQFAVIRLDVNVKLGRGCLFLFPLSAGLVTHLIYI